MTTAGFTSRYYSAQDGLRLHFRDYGDPLAPGVPILCLPGLVRHSIDFDSFAQRHCARHRVLAPDLRGRGLSARDPDYRNYHPLTYVLDLMHLLTLTNCHQVVVVGTSLGGILAMAMATVMPAGLAGAVLNDIGPEVDQRGVERIKSYVGSAVDSMTIEQAAAELAGRFGYAFPDFTDSDWLEEARRSYAVSETGAVSLNYDPAISRALAEQAAEPPDLWPYFRALRHVPVLSLRGDRSDILAPPTVERMSQEHDRLTCLTVADRGHTPTLNEPAVTAALDTFLEPFAHDHG